MSKTEKVNDSKLVGEKAHKVGKNQILIRIPRPKTMVGSKAKIVCTAIKRSSGPLVADFDEYFAVGFPEEYNALIKDMPNAKIEKKPDVEAGL